MEEKKLRYGDLVPPRSIGLNTDGFRVVHGGNRYACLCPCGSEIEDWDHNTPNMYNVRCKKGHILDCEDIVLDFIRKQETFLAKPRKKESLVKPMKCPKCGSVNISISAKKQVKGRACNRCGCIW